MKLQDHEDHIHNDKKSFLSDPSSAEIEGQKADDAKQIQRLCGWRKAFALLQQFEKREGHCDVPHSHTADGIKLGRWVGNQRRLKKEVELDPGRQERLEEINFAWDPGRRMWVPWEERIKLLVKAFKMREGHCNVPRSHQEDRVHLGMWVNTQRNLKQKEKLDPHRQKILEDIGFVWVLVERRQNYWKEIFSLLKQFKTRERHCNVPSWHKEGEDNLGIWVMNQRGSKTTGKLDPARRKMLEDISFEWVLKERGPNVPSEEMHALLKQFKKREGHSNVPQSHKEDGANLGPWVANQRQLKRKEKLDPDRQKIVEALGFELVLFERRANMPWEDILSLLEEFKTREGHCRVPISHTEDKIKLGSWVGKQRHLKKTGKLDPDRQMRLDEVGTEWAGKL
jgi:hypothetical protein